MIKKGRSIGISHVNDQQVHNVMQQDRNIGTGAQAAYDYLNQLSGVQAAMLVMDEVQVTVDVTSVGLIRGEFREMYTRQGQGKSLYPFVHHTAAEELSPTLSNHFKSMKLANTVYLATQTKNKEKNKNHHPNSLYMETLPSHKSIWDQIEDLYKTSYIGEWI